MHSQDKGCSEEEEEEESTSLTWKGSGMVKIVSFVEVSRVMLTVNLSFDFSVITVFIAITK